MNKILDFFNKIAGLLIFLIFLLVLMDHFHHTHFRNGGHHQHFEASADPNGKERTKTDSPAKK